MIGGLAMENVGELIWVVAYLVQMVASAALAELIRRKVRKSASRALSGASRADRACLSGRCRGGWTSLPTAGVRRMAESWSVERAKGCSCGRAGHGSTSCRAKAKVSLVAMWVRKLMSWLGAMYRMPCVHPLASITSDNGRRVAYHDTWLGHQEAADSR